LFLVGDSIDFKDVPIWKEFSVWHSGAIVGILWDAVACFLVFDSIPAYTTALVANAEQQAKLAETQPASNAMPRWPFRRG
jgi:hypothetical protein